MPLKRVAVMAGGFNPPGRHHARVAETLSREFDEVWIVPCGPGGRGPQDEVQSVFRATMVDMTFRSLPKVHVDLLDLEQHTFPRVEDMEARYGRDAEVWHVFGADRMRSESPGKSWSEASWRGARFLVVERPGFPLAEADLPPHHRVLVLDEDASSARIRERIFKREPFRELVVPEVERYIERYGLYRGRIPNLATRYAITQPRLLVVPDDHNPQAMEWAEHFKEMASTDHPNCILVIGGDGVMLRAIRKYWRLRLPFFGINTGHLGFLLNDPEVVFSSPFPPQDLILRQLPLLYVEVAAADGTWHHALAFNDAWVERATSQTAWIEVKVNGQVRLPRLVSDGVLISTAAGSTAYARAMGGPPLPAETQALILAGSNVMDPPNWKATLLSIESGVDVRCLDPSKRPLVAYVDGMSQGQAVRMQARVSRSAAAELAFLSHHDMADKIAHIQFP
ncbi:MAG: NAD(+)/NADH kinase [Candidatus Xenobia bacterium]